MGRTTTTCYLVISNYLSSAEQPASSTSSCDGGGVRLLPLWIGDLVQVCASNGEWCFGWRLEEPEMLGLFPRLHITCQQQQQQMPTPHSSSICETTNGEREKRPATSAVESEANQLANEISRAVTNWWECTKAGYGSGESSAERYEQQMILIKQLIMCRRRLRSDTVPAEELRELRLNVANAIDAGNHAMQLGMHIRDQNGGCVQVEDISVVNAYKRHEEMQQRLNNQFPRILDPELEDKLTAGQSTFIKGGIVAPTNDEYALLISVDYSQLANKAVQQAVDSGFELILGLGRATTRQKSNHHQHQQGNIGTRTRPLSEPLTVRIQSDELRAKSAAALKTCRALFVEITDADLQDPAHSLSLWMTALRMAPLPSEKYAHSLKLSSSSNRGEDVRQFYASGLAELGDVIRGMVDQEQREVTLMLTKKLTTSPTYNVPTGEPDSQHNVLVEHQTKIPITLSIQLFAGTNRTATATIPELRSFHPLKKLKAHHQAAAGGRTVMEERKRNEIFVWLRDADLHGIGKSEKNVEAVVSVVDDDGIFQPEAIQINTPRGAIRESSFRCRVWPAEDRPRFNELIKVLLPDRETRNLHLQILFYNKSTAAEKKANGNGSSSTKAPFALAFLRLLSNYVLCTDDDDDLFIYRVEKGAKAAMANVTNETATRTLSVAYLTMCAKRKEWRQSGGTTIGGGSGIAVPNGGAAARSASLSSTLTRSSCDSQQQLQQQQNGGIAPAGLYTLCEKNLLHFQSFVCSEWHSSNNLLVQIMRWRDHEPHVLRKYLNELANGSDFGEQQLQEELTKFLPHLLDALFQIADTHAALQRPVFDMLVQICRFSEENRQHPNGKHFHALLEQYMQQMHFPSAYTFLLEHIIWYVTNDVGNNSNQQHEHRQQPQSSIPAVGNDQHLLSPTPSFLKTGSNKSNNSTTTTSRDQLLLVLKALGLLVRFALASKCCAELIAARNDGNDNNKEHRQQQQSRHFLQQMDSLRSSLVLLLGSAVRRMTGQNAAMKHLPALIVPLLQHSVYEPLELANFVKEVLDSLSDGILLRQKLLFLGDIVSSELFASQQCRRVLLERFVDELLAQMPPHVRQEEHMRTLQRRESVPMDVTNANGQLEAVHLSAKILTDLLERLFPYSRHAVVEQSGTAQELVLILNKCLRALNQTMVTLLGDPAHQRALHALLLAILDKFSARHFADYFDALEHPLNKIDALSEMLHLFRDLVRRCPAPAEWYQIRRIQCRLLLKHIRFAVGYVQREFGPGEHFEAQMWSECMLSCVEFAKCGDDTEAGGGYGRKCVGGEIQDENCGEDQIDGEEDEDDAAGGNADAMRQFAVKMLRSIWYSLTPEAKGQLIPDMVGPVLEVALCADERLRVLAMPILFDMFTTEHWLHSPWCWATGNITTTTTTAAAAGGVVLRKNIQQQPRTETTAATSSNAGGNAVANRFDEEFVRRLHMALDIAVDGHGTFVCFQRTFNRVFKQQMLPTRGGAGIEDHNAIHAFVQKINKLLDLFTAYLSMLSTDDQLEMGMFCTVQLIDFYQSIGQNALYLVYLYKLYILHISAGNLVEAALTLQRHANLLEWSAQRPLSWLYGARKQNSDFRTQLELKEHLCREMADLFSRGGHWELAIEMNRNLANLYENILFDYSKLATLLRRNAELYEKVIREIRLESNYFLVAFYGKECPSYLVNRKFVFRGQQLELWGAFKQRLLSNNFTDYKFVDSMEDCDEQMHEAGGKFIQIIAVSPLPSGTYTSLLQSRSRLASWYYKHHGIQRFELVRREFRADTKWTQLEDTESMRLWLHKRVITIQRPLPDLLSFCPVVSEQAQEPMNPVDVGIDKVREANDKLAEMSGLVSEGFAQFLMNLGGMIRGIVQADVGGGIRNYQTFFTAQCRAECTEEENRAIEILRHLILEQISLLEFALFVHASTPQVKQNSSFHSSLVDSFRVHRERVETMVGGTAKSILPGGATISLTTTGEQQDGGNNDMAMAHKPGFVVGAASRVGSFTGTESRASVQSSAFIGNNKFPMSSTSVAVNRAHSMAAMECQLMASASNFNSMSTTLGLPPSLCRPPSAASASNSSGSSSNSSGATAFFKHSPLGAASTLIRTTIQGKAKQRMRKNSSNVSNSNISSRKKKLSSASASFEFIDDSGDAIAAAAASGNPQMPSLAIHHQLSGTATAALSHVRISDASIDNCCFQMETPAAALAPPLPARLSNLHSEGYRKGRQPAGDKDRK